MNKICSRVMILFFASLWGLHSFEVQASGLGQTVTSDEKSAIRKFQAAEPVFERARMAFAKKDLILAGKKTEECLRLCPWHADASYLSAQLAYLEGRLEEALAHMVNAERNYALTGSLRLKYQSRQTSSLHTRKKQIEADIAAIQDYLADSTLQLSARDLADYQKQLDIRGQQLAVIASQLMGPEEAPQAPPADYPFLQGNILFKLNRFDEAEVSYLAALAADASHEQAMNNLVNLYFTQRRFEEALARLERAEAQGFKVNAQLKKAVLEALGR